MGNKDGKYLGKSCPFCGDEAHYPSVFVLHNGIVRCNSCEKTPGQLKEMGVRFED